MRVSSAPEESGGRSTLRLIRRSGYRDRFRSYKILINGIEAGTIARDTVLELEVPSGPVTIEARIDWGRSRPLIVDVPPMGTIEVEVSHNPKPRPALWEITFGFRTYLTLRELPAQ